jgi:hypothetical protein
MKDELFWAFGRYLFIVFSKHPSHFHCISSTHNSQRHRVVVIWNSLFTTSKKFSYQNSWRVWQFNFFSSWYSISCWRSSPFVARRVTTVFWTYDDWNCAELLNFNPQRLILRHFNITLQTTSRFLKIYFPLFSFNKIVFALSVSFKCVISTLSFHIILVAANWAFEEN